MRKDSLIHSFLNLHNNAYDSSYFLLQIFGEKANVFPLITALISLKIGIRRLTIFL